MPVLLLLFFLLFSTPVFADSTCPSTVPRPESAEIDQIIAEAQSRGGAAANVPAKVLEAIYSVEAGPYYSNPNAYTCPIITVGANNYLGPMAINDVTYRDIVSESQRFLDINQEAGMCAPNYCNKLSRCNPSDAMEMAARVLLLKLRLWDNNNIKPLGSITTKEQIYNATCLYYDTFDPTPATNKLLASWKPWLLPNPNDGQLSYCEYILAYIGELSYYWPRPTKAQPLPLPPAPAPKPFTFKPYCNAALPTNISYLLRPNPNDLVPSEKNKTINDPTLTPYCIQRPTVVQNVTYNKALPQPTITFSGTLYTDFTSFTTPFLNSETQSSYQYLNQYLGDHPASTMESLGMFEKLAPQTYQNQLRIAMINRALGTFTVANNPYGFDPATPTVHDYPVACWDGNKIVDFTDPSKGTCGSNQLLKLSSFKDNLIPLPEDYLDKETYQAAIEAWKIKDNSKWFQAWQFIPKFTLEDTKGFIKVIPEPGQTASPTQKEVSHPFLAKTYELSSALFNLLTPYEPPPMENYNTEQWYGPPWETDPWWFKSDENQSQWLPNVGPICDQTTPVIYGAGALAFGGPISNTVNKTFTLSIAPDPSCIIYHTDPITGIVTEDYSNCMVTQKARYSPVYDESYTPFLKEINSNLYAPNGIFNLMEPYNPEKKDYYPAAASDKTANFSYIPSQNIPGQAEAGMKLPGETAQFLYRYLGSIHCAKQKLISAIQPFFGGEIGLSPECQNQEPGLLPKTPPIENNCSEEKLALGFTNDSSSPIAKRAWEIVSDLYQGFWCYWNRSPGDFPNDTTTYPPSYPELFDESLYSQIPNPTTEQLNQRYFNMFWCTWLVVKSFNENNNSIPTELWVPNMIESFKTKDRYLDASTITYQDVSPGDAIFFRIPENNYRSNHVGIVYSVSADGVTSVESNAGYKTMFYPTDTNGHFQILGTGADTIKVEGFGTQ